MPSQITLNVIPDKESIFNNVLPANASILATTVYDTIVDSRFGSLLSINSIPTSRLQTITPDKVLVESLSGAIGWPDASKKGQIALYSINEYNLANRSITPTKLTIGAPTWNSAGDVAVTGELSAPIITKILSLLGASPSLNGIRLSFTNSTATPTTNITNANVLYVHPYRGNVITLYNMTTQKWDIYPFNDIKSYPLVCPSANTNYDIFIYRSNDDFAIEFVPWGSSEAGIAGPIRVYQDGAIVKSVSEKNKRFIGCLRTTSANTSEQSFGGRVAGGAAPKQFLWNAQNQVPVSCYSFETGTYYYNNTPFSTTIGGTTTNGYWTGYQRVNPNSALQGRGNRFSFITGDYNTVNLLGQIYNNANNNANNLTHTALIVAYVAAGINSDSAITSNESMMVSELMFMNMTPRCQVLKSFNSGYHFIQLFENLGNYTGQTINFIMNEDHTNQTGFLASLTN